MSIRAEYTLKSLRKVGVSMRKKLPRLLRPNVRLYFVLLTAFACATYFFGSYNQILAGVMAIVIIFAAIFLLITSRRRNEKLLNYLDSISDSIDLTARDTPLPVLVYNSENGEIIWSNERFNTIVETETSFFQGDIADIIPDYTWDWLLGGKSECDEPVKVGDKQYCVYGSIIISNHEYVAITYWVDVTQYAELCISFAKSRPIHTLMTLDNYDELLKGMSATEKSLLLSDIDEKIAAWVNGKDGYLCKYDRDRYFFLFEERFLDEIVKENFSVLDRLNSCVGAGGVVATLSIGIGKDGATPQENHRFANLGIEMALSRGGNQAVVRNKYGFEFFGGRPQHGERRTKVKARVMANAFGELLSDASKVYVMGHKVADYDSIGAAIGVCCIARSKRKPAYVIVNRKAGVTGEDYLNMFMHHTEYNGVFISEQQALLDADKKTLLVVVDTNRPDQVESQPLLLSCTRIAIIDHHRRAADYIDNAVLNFHEPYASSAAELVTEMLQNLIDRREDILRAEADALLAGIVLDTKSFSINTGIGTFDAAAHLKRVGADPEFVKRLLQSDFGIVSARYGIMQSAEIYADSVALAVSREKQNKITIAQAADELLEIKGILTSFVVARVDNAVCVSGRNIGDINVQVILEKLGGGGNAATAGFQTETKSVDEVVAELKHSIDDYMKKNSKR